jgi:ABC-type transport system involved in cytochrome c biogenesis permease component
MNKEIKIISPLLKMRNPKSVLAPLFPSFFNDEYETKHAALATTLLGATLLAARETTTNAHEHTI